MVVVVDCPDALSVNDDGVRGVGQVDEEVFVCLDREVAFDGDDYLFAGLSLVEGERAASGGVVGGGRRGDRTPEERGLTVGRERSNYRWN